MPRPKNKDELISAAELQYEKLLTFIKDHPELKDREFPKEKLNRNTKDVLFHLHHWHLMLLGWYELGMKGEKPAMPAPGMTWKDTPRLNIEIQAKYANESFAEGLKKLDSSHQSITTIIQKHTNEELFTKKRYKWTGSTSMGAYLISATSSHYDWAIKLIKKCSL